MYMEDEIRAAACGESACKGGLNLPDIKKILTASGLSTSGNGDEVRATLKENLDTCLAQQVNQMQRARLLKNLNKCLAWQGLVTDADKSPTSKLDTSTDTAKSEEATPQSTLYL